MATVAIDPRVTELLELAEAEGLTLPFSPEFIVGQEDAGNVVDLVTGEIGVGAANQAFTPTAAGLAEE